ncbi:thermonuclease family protein [Domibacillus indicus]|uniref:thermonuclease family protein n=1 Tax=Domibacillus indicus TaxID=1437523 RepID=UPI000695E35C|nr:thermonuclease family protein [Domibacillus indicus]
MLQKKFLKPFAASLLFFSLLAGSFTPTFNNEPTQIAEAALPKTATKVTVNEVVDGDTVKVTYNGKVETVCVILIDTLETKHPDKCVQLYGPEATAYTKKYLLDKSKTVSIELGVQQRDKYGRLLTYVYINETMFKKLLLQNGLARIAVYPPNTQYLDELKAVEAKAKSGIWSSKNATNGGCVPTKKPAPAPKPVPKSAPKPAPAPTKESF